jgi:hypothetical protein
MDYIMEGYEIASFNDLLLISSSTELWYDDPNLQTSRKKCVFELVTDLMEDADVRVTAEIW